MNRSVRETDRMLTAEFRRFQLTWADVGAFLKEYSWAIVWIFLATVLATYSVLSLYSDKYETSAKLLVKVGRETVDPPPTASTRGGSLVTSGVRREEVNSEVQILTSQNLAEQVVDALGTDRFKAAAVPPEGFVARVKFEVKKLARVLKGYGEDALIALGLQKKLTDREKAITGLAKEIEVGQEKETDVITMRLKTSDPSLGKEVMSKWIEFYLEQHLAIRAYTGVREFLSAETGSARARLMDAEAARDKWKREHELSNTGTQKETLIRQIREQVGTRDVALSEIEMLTAQVAETRLQLSRLPGNLKVSEVEAPNPPMQIYRNELAGLELQKTKLLAKYQADSERIRLLDEEMARLNTLIANEEARQISQSTLEINPQVKTLENRLQEDSVRLEGLKRRVKAQTVQIADLRLELASLESADVRLLQLERERQVAEDLFFGLVRRANDADIGAGLDRSRLSNVSVMAPPTSTIEPVYPRRQLIMGVSLALGLLMGIGLCLLYDYMSGRARSANEVADATDLPYLGSVRVEQGSGS
jgi:uncharacterized protein involved in exopolysaccharide biosynthesis